jgi:peroxiredoxin Q/BCP
MTTIEEFFNPKDKTVLHPHDKAPNFSLEGDDGSIHSLSDYSGKMVVIFFYPKDLTPGCTTEACDFSSNLSQFADQNAVVLGISKDSLASHARFKSKHSLGMLLLSDPDLAVHQQYGAFGSKILYGKSSLGVIRSTFLIDTFGQIVRAWYRVRVKNHVQAVLDTLIKHKDHPEMGEKNKNAEGGTRTRTGKPGRF